MVYFVLADVYIDGEQIGDRLEANDPRRRGIAGLCKAHRGTLVVFLSL